MSTTTRADLAELLRHCGVLTLREQCIEDGFITGDADLPISDLGMDSLSALEFCIALENRWGVSVSPDEVNRLGTLGQLSAVLAGEHVD